MFGMVAVGTEFGHLYIIDLRADDKDELFIISDPSELFMVEPSKINQMASFRELSLEQGKHCCIDLNCKIFVYFAKMISY